MQKHTQNIQNTVDINIIILTLSRKFNITEKNSIYKLVTVTFRILFWQSQSNLTYLFGRGFFDID